MTDTARKPLTDDDLLELDQLALERAKRKESIEAETERVKQIDAILRDRLPQGSTPLGATTVLVKAGAKRLNATRFAAAFPVETWPGLYKTTVSPDSAAIKEQLAPAVLAAANVHDEGTPVVQVR